MFFVLNYPSIGYGKWCVTLMFRKTRHLYNWFKIWLKRSYLHIFSPFLLYLYFLIFFWITFVSFRIAIVGMGFTYSSWSLTSTETSTMVRNLVWEASKAICTDSRRCKPPFIEDLSIWRSEELFTNSVKHKHEHLLLPKFILKIKKHLKILDS